jgi:hypothetical protein
MLTGPGAAIAKTTHNHNLSLSTPVRDFQLVIEAPPSKGRDSIVQRFADVQTNIDGRSASQHDADIGLNI